MKLKKFLGVLFLCLVVIGGFTSCTTKEEEKKDDEDQIEPIDPPKPTTSIEVKFDTDGGSVIETVKLNEAGKVAKPADPTKESCVFAGWYSDAAKVFVFDFNTQIISANTTLYAKWERIITCAEATKLCEPEGYKSTERFYIRGTVDKITNPTYGEMTISDATGSLYVYGTYSADGADRYSELEDKPYAGDEVYLYGLLENYNGTAELKSAWIKEVVHKKVEFNEADYTAASVKQAREAEKGTKVKVTGVVAKITYANGMIPSGFYLVDSTESIYVYDSQITPRVQIGNKITIAAEKDYWILDTEQANAAKFGYEGCCQLSSAYLLENDEKTTNAFDKSWIKESTVKAIMDTPVTENITTTIFKVNALVKKVPGAGFVNYYIDDIDGVTGSYVYTQCNGKDYEWLDEFDGKICTVYLSAINAKSNVAGCSWRLFPIEVFDDGYVFDLEDSSEFAVTYYGVDQFEKKYNSDPYLELITSVSSDLLGIQNVQLEYSSSNPDVVSFVLEGDKLFMHTNQEGTATITIKSKYMDYAEYSVTLDIEVVALELPETKTIKEVLDIDPLAGAVTTPSSTEVYVRGIVGPSLVNKVGFYLIDSTGAIAITVKEAETLEKVSLGNEVILKGNRTLFGHQNEEGKAYCYGQSVILDCELIVNLYGKNEYDKTTFDSTKTLEELMALSIEEDFTAQVFVLDAMIKVVEEKNYTNIYVVSPTNTEKELRLYCSSASQYNWLKAFDGETVKVELMLCNWNKKTYYTGCVLSATNEAGETVYNTLNFKK